MNLFKTTKQHSEWWRTRKIDWKKSYTDTWNHPHRGMIVQVLKNINWLSLIELGCGSGPNLLRIVKEIPGRQVGGVDVNEDAIELARQSFKGNVVMKVGSADDVMLSDKSTDIILSDMMLIYVSPHSIHRYIAEMKRLARNYVILCEFDSKSWWNRLVLRFNSGYNAYDYKKLLEKHDFYDIVKIKIPEKSWPGGSPQKEFAYIIVARLPKI